MIANFEIHRELPTFIECDDVAEEFMVMKSQVWGYVEEVAGMGFIVMKSQVREFMVMKSQVWGL